MGQDIEILSLFRFKFYACMKFAGHQISYTKITTHVYLRQQNFDTKHVMLLGMSFVYELIFGHVSCNIARVAFPHQIR